MQDGDLRRCNGKPSPVLEIKVLGGLRLLVSSRRALQAMESISEVLHDHCGVPDVEAGRLCYVGDAPALHALRRPIGVGRDVKCATCV